MGQLEDALRALLAGYMRQVRMWPAVIGAADGTVNVPGQPGWVWVRWSEAEGEQAMRCYNGSKVAAEAGLAVVVGYDFLNPQIFAVLSERLIMPGDKPAPVVGSGADGQLAVWGAGALAGADTLSDALHGALSGGDLHAAATESTAGFMTAEDKRKLDGLGPGGAFCGAAVRRTSSYGVASDTVDYLPFSSAEFDSDGFWSNANPTRLTAPAAGYYLVTAFIRWTDAIDSYQRGFYVAKNRGETYYGSAIVRPTAEGYATASVSSVVYMSSGEYIELLLYCSVAASIYIGGQFPRMSMVRLG